MGKLKDANKKIEDAVVGGYKKIEDKFVDKFLRKDDETIEDAKERVKNEQEELKKKNEMKKETLIEIILGTIGGLVFAIGMCMCLLPEWNMFTAGVVTAIIGFAILLCIIPVYRKSHPKKEKENKPINWGIVLTWTVGVVGSLIMGFGMSKILVEGSDASDMIVGIVTGVIGLIVCVLNYPIYAYIKSNKEK